MAQSTLKAPYDISYETATRGSVVTSGWVRFKKLGNVCVITFTLGCSALSGGETLATGLPDVHFAMEFIGSDNNGRIEKPVFRLADGNLIFKSGQTAASGASLRGSYAYLWY